MVKEKEPYRHPIPRSEDDERYEKKDEEHEEEEKVNYLDKIPTPKDNSWEEFQNDMDMMEDLWEDDDDDDESF